MNDKECKQMIMPLSFIFNIMGFELLNISHTKVVFRKFIKIILKLIALLTFVWCFYFHTNCLVQIAIIKEYLFRVSVLTKLVMIVFNYICFEFKITEIRKLIKD